MNTKKIIAKGHMFFLVCFFISTATLAQQQNIIGIKGNSGELMSVDLTPVSYVNGIRTDNGEVQSFSILSLYEMHQLNCMELNNTVYGSLRFDGNKIYASTLDSQEHLINITVNKNYNTVTGEEGTATLYFEGGDYLDIEFVNIFTSDISVWMFMYFIPEKKDSEDEFYDVLTAKEKEIEQQNEPVNGFYVSVHYLIKE
ncbi:MAG: hypothetical protein LBH30_07255 [Prevotellaceae bacterium]|jgi:hypothetical protein|nr:hypothetical protein [Prevotellaceae bacterium]